MGKRILSLLVLLVVLSFAVAVPAATLSVTWNANPAADNITAYTVRAATVSGGPYTVKQVVGAGVLNYQLTGLSPLTTYFVVLTASNAGGESGPTAEVSAKTLINPPGAPAGVAAVAVPASSGL